MCSQVSLWRIKKQIKNLISVNSGDLGERKPLFLPGFSGTGVLTYICSSVNGVRTKSSKIYAENIILQFTEIMEVFLLLLHTLCKNFLLNGIEVGFSHQIGSNREVLGNNSYARIFFQCILKTYISSKFLYLMGTRVG